MTHASPQLNRDRERDSREREILERHGCGLVAPQGDYAQLLADVGTLIEDGARRELLALRGPAVAFTSP